MANEVIETYLLGLIVLFPALGALLWGTVGRMLPRRLVGAGATLSVAVPFVLGVIAILVMVSNPAESHGHAMYPTLTQTLWSWFGAGSLSVEFAFALDPLNAVVLLVITGVGSLIHLYSMSYMADDESYARYFAYLNLFVAAMLVLVLADNLVLLFLGWEGVGVASYLLIGFWFSDGAKADAGKKAFITNRVGDLAFLLALFLLFQLAGGFDFETLREWASGLNATQIVADGSTTSFGWLLTLICVLFFIGCTGKSAQIPLHVWLPDAMAGPTPVSALIHAATMVTAGVYLIARLGFLFSLAPWALAIVAVVGALSALIAALIATVQTDIKKVLAYSTISQLGFMFVAVGSGSYFAGVFHLMTHAFFKALLFLGAGAVIHALHGEQDITKMGDLRTKLRVTGGTFLVGCFAIAGLPLITSGFYSKDEVLWFALSNVNVLGGPSSSPIWGWGLWLVMTATAGLTAFYMFRLYFLVFESPTRLDAEAQAHIHAPGWEMHVPLVVLAVLSVVGGFVAIPHALGGPIGGTFFDLHGWLYGAIDAGEGLYSSRFASGAFVYVSMIAAILMSLGGMYLAFRLYAKPSEVPGAVVSRLGRVHRVIENRFYFDELYAATFGRALYWGGVLLHRVVDELAVQTLLVGSVASGTRLVGTVLRQLHNGDVQRYVALTVMSIAVVVYLLVR
jgi:NADH-quinone oxidoreductase subunit L